VTTTAGVSPSTPSPTGPNYAQLAVDKLVDALPTLDDMPAGYTAETPETKDTNETFCNDKQPMSGRAVAESWSYWPTRLSSDITGSVTQAAKA
jgi:hypothetical protein